MNQPIRGYLGYPAVLEVLERDRVNGRAFQVTSVHSILVAVLTRPTPHPGKPLPLAAGAEAENQWDRLTAPATVRLVPSEPRDIVEAGYDRIAVRHLAWINEIKGDPPPAVPARPDDPPSAAVLDLGCGAGVPCTALLAERGDVVGIDL